MNGPPGSLLALPPNLNVSVEEFYPILNIAVGGTN